MPITFTPLNKLTLPHKLFSRILITQQASHKSDSSLKGKMTASDYQHSLNWAMQLLLLLLVFLLLLLLLLLFYFKLVSCKNASDELDINKAYRMETCRLDAWKWQFKFVRALHHNGVPLKRPPHGKLKLANSCWQTQVVVCEGHKNSRQTRFYLTPTVCKRVCRLFLCRSHTHQLGFANTSLPT